MKPISRRVSLLKRGCGLLIVGVILIGVSALGVEQRDPSLKRIKERGRLKVCADKFALPFSSNDPDMPGLDNEIAADIARRLGVRLELVWLDTGAWGGRSKGVMRRKLVTKECDCMVGLPIQVAATMQFASTRPYLGTCFALAIPEGGRRFEMVEELEGMQVGSAVNSPPWRVLYKKGWNPSFGYRYGWEILQAVDSGELDAGFVWAPSAGWYILNHPGLAVELLPAQVMLPQFRWNTAVSLRPGEEALREAIDQIVAEIVESGMVETLAGKYGVPYFAPFDIESY